MTEHGKAPVGHAPPGRSGYRYRYRTPVTLIVTFVIGLVVGGIVVAIFSSGNHFTVAPVPSRSAPSAGSTATGAPSGGAQAQIDGDCLRAVNEARAVASALGGLAAAGRDLNVAALDAIVRQVQHDQRRLRADLAGCHAVVVLPSGSTSTGPLPTPTP